MKLYAKYTSATDAARFSTFFEKPFVNLVNRRFVIRTRKVLALHVASPGRDFFYVDPAAGQMIVDFQEVTDLFEV